MGVQEQTINNPQHYFYLQTRTLKTITELLTINKEEYERHVKQENNDFANWVQHVFKETELAQELRETTTYEEFKKTIHEALENDFENEEDDEEQQEHKEEQELVEQKKQPVSSEEEKQYTGEEGIHYRDQLSEKFDEAHKRLEEKTVFETPESTTKQLEIIQEKERTIRQEISEQRKKGYDLFIADIILQKLKPLVDMAKATNEQEDFDNIETLFKEVREEIEHAKNNPLPDIKKEIDELVAQHKQETQTTQ